MISYFYTTFIQRTTKNVIISFVKLFSFVINENVITCNASENIFTENVWLDKSLLFLNNWRCYNLLISLLRNSRKPSIPEETFSFLTRTLHVNFPDLGVIRYEKLTHRMCKRFWGTFYFLVCRDQETSSCWPPLSTAFFHDRSVSRSPSCSSPSNLPKSIQHFRIHDSLNAVFNSDAFHFIHQFRHASINLIL